MDERIARLKSSKDARTFAKNARERGHVDLESEALQRARELQAIEEGHTTPAQQAIATALYAYEEHQTTVKGRPFRASRTRQMFANHGPIVSAERMVMTRQPSMGYGALEEAGLQELSFEAIIVRFPDEFSARAVEFAHARLDGTPLPPIPARAIATDASEDVDELNVSTPIRWDAEATSFLEGFKNPGIWHRSQWLPRYRIMTSDIARSLSDGQFDLPFDFLWKRQRNDISNAGRGVLKHETVEGMRVEFIQVVHDIHEDGSPENHERIVERFEGWKNEGRTEKVPHLLIARAFAGIHPRRYHTTVDASSQKEMLEWFVEHTGFVMPRRNNWAFRAHSLVNYLDRTNLFSDDFHARNIFPWFVVDQLHGRNASPDIPPGHTPRPDSAFAHLPAAERFIKLRHNKVQTALVAVLQAQFGNRVWTEYPTGTGGQADAYVRHDDGRCYLYEIKIADSASLVVRQAMGQLLEYGFRQGGLQPEKLFVVGEPALDEVTERFLARLRHEFNLDTQYLQISLPDAPLVQNGHSAPGCDS
jgi:hypothetical protein